MDEIRSDIAQLAKTRAKAVAACARLLALLIEHHPDRYTNPVAGKEKAGACLLHGAGKMEISDNEQLNTVAAWPQYSRTRRRHSARPAAL
jgi:hypothetical protein